MAKTSKQDDGKKSKQDSLANDKVDALEKLDKIETSIVAVNKILKRMGLAEVRLHRKGKGE